VISSWGGRRYPPYAFSEQGVAMLSSVLKSEQAINVNIAVMRANVRIASFTLKRLDILMLFCIFNTWKEKIKEPQFILIPNYIGH